VRFRLAETAHLRFAAGKIELDRRVGWMQVRRPRGNSASSRVFFEKKSRDEKGATTVRLE
jgi:hypothetical protein